MSPHGIHVPDGNIPSRGSAFGGPALLSWSRPHERPTLLVSARPRTSIIMLLHGRHRRWVASVALLQNCEYRLRQAYWSRPVPPNHWNRRAFPHGKACSGCAASLPPPLCTAVRRPAGRDPPTAALAQDGRQSVSPSHWSRPGPRSGRPSAALQRRSACSDRTAPVLSPSTTLVRATNRHHWALTASAAQAEGGRQTVSPAYQSLPRPRPDWIRAVLRRARA